jgi:hypothetical protein
MKRNPSKREDRGVGQKRKSWLKRNPTFLLLKKIIEENCGVLFLASSIFPIPRTLKTQEKQK